MGTINRIMTLVTNKGALNCVLAKQATKWLDRIAKSDTNIFSHWKFGVTPTAG